MMMSATLVDVPMLKFFAAGLAQSHNLHIEMQFVPCQGMIKV